MHFLSLAKEKLLPVADDLSENSKNWCNQHSISLEKAIEIMRVKDIHPNFKKDFKDELDYAQAKIQESPITLGGGACGELLFYCAEKVEAKSIVETGVAFGWSSLCFLLSLNKRNEGRLLSTDVPYLVEPHLHVKNHEYVGSVVPEKLRHKWTIIKKRDRSAIPIALKMAQQIDLCHYDSDKTYRGRMYAYPLLWGSLRTGGIFISDDVSDNQAFKVFCKKIDVVPIIVKLKNKYVGIIIKH